MIRDVLGRAHESERPPQRVVSLVPSITETLFEIGVGASVVAVTDFCIFPPDLNLPRVGGTKNPRVENIRALRPDLVHMNLEENLPKHAQAIETFASVFASEPKSVDDVESLIAQLGSLHGRQQRAFELNDALRSARAAVRKRHFTFACPIWKRPWMWCGGDTYVSNLIGCAGGKNVLNERVRYPAVDLEDVLALRPDIVFLPDEPYVFTPDDAATIIGPRVIGPFAGHLFTWHGSRTVEGLRFLAQILQD